MNEEYIKQISEPPTYDDFFDDRYGEREHSYTPFTHQCHYEFFVKKDIEKT